MQLKLFYKLFSKFWSIWKQTSIYRRVRDSCGGDIHTNSTHNNGIELSLAKIIHKSKIFFRPEPRLYLHVVFATISQCSLEAADNRSYTLSRQPTKKFSQERKRCKWDHLAFFVAGYIAVGLFQFREVGRGRFIDLAKRLNICSGISLRISE